MNKVKRSLLLTTSLLLAFLVLAALLFALPLAAAFRTDSGQLLHAWRSRTFFNVFPVIVIALLAATAFSWYWIGRLLAPHPGKVARCLLALRPLLMLPAIVCGGYLAPWIGLTASGLILPYGTALIAAWTLENLLGDSIRTGVSSHRHQIFSWSILAYGIFIFAAGLHFNKKIGTRSGDEVHYLIQLQSLIDDGDLELSSEMASTIAEHGHSCLAYSHIIENTEGKLYSYHAFGLPLLAWPFGYLGAVGRQLILAIIAALAVAGCRAACLAAKASPKSAAIVTWTLAFSYVWAMYSTRFLPETLGCGLIAWGCWTLAAQNERRWTATLVAALCCGFLPYAHVRWAPPSLVIAAFFGFEGLFLKGERPRAKFARLCAFSAIYAAFGFGLLKIHATLYSGSQAYNYEKILFDYPMAMWGMFIDRRGLLGLLPALLWMVVSIPSCLTLGRRSALRATESGAILAVTLMTSCTTTAALSGACIPGRYLLTAVPALLPPAALVLSRCPRPARIWYYFLAAMPVLFYAFVGSWIRGSPAAFLRVPEKLREYIGFHTYWEPLPSIIHNHAPAAITWASVFVLALVLFSALLIAGRKRPHLVTVLATAALVVALAAGFKSDALENGHRNTSLFLLSKDHPWKCFFLGTREPEPEIFTTLSGAPPVRPYPLTTLSDRNKLPEEPASFLSLKQIPFNDWDGRNIRWHVIRPNQIRHNFNGYFAFRVVGRVNRGQARFAVRQGAFSLEEDHVLGEGNFDFTWVVRTRKGRGFTNTIMSLEGETGEVVVDYVQLAPFSPHMLTSGFYFTPSTQIRDLTGLSTDGPLR